MSSEGIGGLTATWLVIPTAINPSNIRKRGQGDVFDRRVVRRGTGVRVTSSAYRTSAYSERSRGGVVQIFGEGCGPPSLWSAGGVSYWRGVGMLTSSALTHAEVGQEDDPSVTVMTVFINREPFVTLAVGGQTPHPHTTVAQLTQLISKDSSSQRQDQNQKLKLQR